MATNKKHILKGLQFLAASLFVTVVGIYTISFSFVNKINTATVLGIIITGFAMFLMFKGITTIMKGIYNEK